MSLPTRPAGGGRGETWLRCEGCGIELSTRRARYLYLNYGWRGARASRVRPRETRHYCLCGPCGIRFLELTASNLIYAAAADICAAQGG